MKLAKVEHDTLWWGLAFRVVGFFVALARQAISGAFGGSLQTGETLRHCLPQSHWLFS